MATRRSHQEAGIEAILSTLATTKDISDLKSDLTWRMIIAMSILTAIFATIVSLVFA